MEGEKPLRTVQLRHVLPDGSHHFDWMIAQDSGGKMPLLTLRLDRRVDELKAGESARATRLADHRPRYLDYEGPVSGNRGSVTREAAGHVVRSISDSDRNPHDEIITAQWRLQGAILMQELSLTRISEENWIVTCTRRDD